MSSVAMLRSEIQPRPDGERRERPIPENTVVASMTRPGLQPLLAIEGVACSFGGQRALDGTTFTVSKSRITGLIGPNGAGKTTLFNCITGLQRKSKGRVVFDGVDITRMRPDQISAKGLTRTFQLARGCPRMTVYENLMVYGKDQPGERLMSSVWSRGRAKARERALSSKALEVAESLRLSHVLDNLVTDLSGGQKKLLEIGRAVLAEPSLILLDEPMAGVNPTLVGEIATQLERISASGVSILLIEHDMGLIERLCSEVIVMAEGRFMTRGTFAEVAANRAVQDAYLGVAQP